MMQEDFKDYEEVKESNFYNKNDDYNDYYEPIQHQEVEKCCYCNEAITPEEESSGNFTFITSNSLQVKNYYYCQLSVII